MSFVIYEKNLTSMCARIHRDYSMEHIVQKATIIVEQTEELSLEEATTFFAEIFFQSTSLQKRVQAQVGWVYTGEKKQ